MNTVANTTPSHAETTSGAAKRRLPLRDWLLLPLLSVGTIALLACATETFARHQYAESKTSTLACLNVRDPQFGVSALPNTACTQKMKESRLIDYRFNDCGLRSTLPCGPAPEGTYRIALLGSSLAEGMWVPQPETFAALLPGKLSALTGRKVDLYNLAMQWETPHNAVSRVDQAIAAKPSVVIWQLGPFDIENATLKYPFIPGKPMPADADASTSTQNTPATASVPAPTSMKDRIREAAEKHHSIGDLLGAAWTRLTLPLDDTYTVFLVKHALYQSQSQFLKQYLTNSSSSGFLHKQTPPEVIEQLGILNGYMDQVSAKLKAAGIPLVIVFLPNRAQTDMVSSGTWAATYDPYQLENEVKQMAAAHGAGFVEVAHDLPSVSNPDSLYYSVDGHLTPKGQGVVADLLAKELSQGALPGLRAGAEGATR